MQKNGNIMRKFVSSILIGLVAVLTFGISAKAENAYYSGSYYDFGQASIMDGVYAGDISLGGLSKKGAIEAIKAKLADKGKVIFVLKDEEGNGYEIPAEELLPSWDNPEIIKEAGQYICVGNVLHRYMLGADLARTNITYDLAFSVDRDILVERVNEIAGNFTSGAVNASLSRENDEFVIIPGTPGYGVNVETTADKIIEAFGSESGNDIVTLPLEMGDIEPSLSEEDLAQITDVLGTFTTKYKSSGSSRCNNIRNACSKVNGTILMPGEEFSTLAVIAPFTIANGYKEAGSYAGGKVVQSVGGGICQVSTTLYNAVLFAELEVTNRRNHAMMVDYVKVGRDATVSSDSGIDFKFRNNTRYPIYIEGTTTSDKTITITIYGVDERPEGREVSYETDILETISPGPEAVYADPSQPVGFFETQPAHTGYVADVYKIVTENGEEVSREVISHSSYKMTSKYAIVGTGTSDPTTLNALVAAISTGSISYTKGVVNQICSGTYVVPTPVPVPEPLPPAVPDPAAPAPEAAAVP